MALVGRNFTSSTQGWVAINARFTRANDLFAARLARRKHFVVHVDRELTAFLQLDSGIWRRRVASLQHQEMRSISQFMRRSNAADFAS
jgi:hypothetical protein